MVGPLQASFNAFSLTLDPAPDLLSPPEERLKLTIRPPWFHLTDFRYVISATAR